MSLDLLRFFGLQRCILGVCPVSGRFFRLSQCKIYRRERPTDDWLDRIKREEDQLALREEKLDSQESAIREKARLKGRAQAMLPMRRIDHVFLPRKLNADDAKVLFNPIDYIVFKGMKLMESIQSILFLDREGKTAEHRALQTSIERTISQGHYEWQTLHVSEDGSIEGV